MKSSIKQIIFSLLKPCAVVIISLGLVNCGSNGIAGNSGGFQQNHGPFDKNGNYIESWADNPPAQNRNWKPSSPKSESILHSLAKKDVPETPPMPVLSPVKPIPQPIVSYTAPRPVVKTTYSQPKKPTPTKTTYSQPEKPTPTKTTNTPPKKPTPPVVAKQPTAKKIIPKAKPPVVHVVKKGDTLYELSVKYKVSVASIQKANGIRSSNLVIGKRLSIPRK